MRGIEPCVLEGGGSTAPGRRFFILNSHEVDIAQIDVDADEFDLQSMADVETLCPRDQLSLDRWIENSDPGSLFGGAGH